jgi:hypothetical protein
LAELAGYTSRVSDLLDTMEEVKAGRYQKKLVSSSDVDDNVKSEYLISVVLKLMDSATGPRSDYRI